LALTEQQIDLRVFVTGVSSVPTRTSARRSRCTVSVLRKTEWSYPGVGEDSLLHAKVIYLEGEQGRVLGAGSANLTLSGWARNQEVFHFQPINALSLYQSVKAFFQALFTNVGVPCPWKIGAVARSPALSQPCGSATVFRGNRFSSSCWASVLAITWQSGPLICRRDLALFVSHLRSSYEQARMKVSLVPDRLDGQFLRTGWTEALGDLLANDELRLRHNPTTVDERTPMTHAKLWKTSTHLAIGSWNFTRAGSNSLLDSRGKGYPATTSRRALSCRTTVQWKASSAPRWTPARHCS
jgi:hypothetical protein